MSAIPEGVGDVVGCMVVFAPDHFESLRARWSSRSEREWPLIAVIALKDRNSEVRALVERYVARVHAGEAAGESAESTSIA